MISLQVLLLRGQQPHTTLDAIREIRCPATHFSVEEVEQIVVHASQE